MTRPDGLPAGTMVAAMADFHTATEALGLQVTKAFAGATDYVLRLTQQAFAVKRGEVVCPGGPDWHEDADTPGVPCPACGASV